MSALAIICSQYIPCTNPLCQFLLGSNPAKNNVNILRSKNISHEEKNSESSSWAFHWSIWGEICEISEKVKFKVVYLDIVEESCWHFFGQEFGMLSVSHERHQAMAFKAESTLYLSSLHTCHSNCQRSDMTQSHWHMTWCRNGSGKVDLICILRAAKREPS